MLLYIDFFDKRTYLWPEKIRKNFLSYPFLLKTIIKFIFLKRTLRFQWLFIVFLTFGTNRHKIPEYFYISLINSNNAIFWSCNFSLKNIFFSLHLSIGLFSATIRADLQAKMWYCDVNKMLTYWTMRWWSQLKIFIFWDMTLFELMTYFHLTEVTNILHGHIFRLVTLISYTYSTTKIQLND